MSETVAAVVVTYNRKQLLTECLDALLTQTRPVDKIILIDNASTDGAPELLEERGYLANPVMDYVRLPENTGGAGGFYEGVKRGYQTGYDWLWLMDDDGVPDIDCLKNLLNATPENAVLSPASLRIDEVQYLSVPAGIAKKLVVTQSELDALADENGLVFGWSCFFHGTLMHRTVPEKCGFPRPELFMWGDEEEYQIRIMRSGFSLGTQVNALFFHPAERRVFQYLFGKYGVLDFSRTWKYFCYFRNHAYIGKMHGYRHSIKFFLIYCYYTIIKRKSIGDFSFFVSAFFDGWFNRFKKRVPF